MSPSSVPLLLSVARAQSLGEQAAALQQEICAYLKSDDLDMAVKVCVRVVEGDGLLPLLLLMQGVPRDANADFRPHASASPERVAAADSALLLLLALYETGLHAINHLLAPFEKDGAIQWPLTVVYWRERDLLLTRADSDLVAVLDVLKSDSEDAKADTMRGLFLGVWRGPFQPAQGEQDMEVAPGSALESWSAATLVGLVLPTVVAAERCRALIVGMRDPTIVAFLQRHFPLLDLVVVEINDTVVDAAFSFFGVNPTRVQVLSNLEDVTARYFNVCIVNLPPQDVCYTLVSAFPDAGKLVVNAGADAEQQQRLRELFGSVFVYQEEKLREEGDDDMILELCSPENKLAMSLDGWLLGVKAPSSGAMSVGEATDTNIVRLPELLSPEEIAFVHKQSAIARSNGVQSEARSEAWTVLFLQHQASLEKLLPELRNKILATVFKQDHQHWRLFEKVGIENVHIRVAEYHRMCRGGNLADPMHYDLDSLLTIDIMLSDPGRDFEGGEFQTREADGSFCSYEFGLGDAMLFVSHKPHCVSEVTAGVRQVLVLELWSGPERHCPHRCEQFGRSQCPLDQCQGHQESAQEHSQVPFRLGSVKQDGEVTRLLWEPAFTTTDESLQPQGIQSAEESLAQAWELFD